MTNVPVERSGGQGSEGSEGSEGLVPVGDLSEEEVERELFRRLAVKLYGPAAEPVKPPRKMTRIETLGQMVAWAEESVRAEKGPRVSMDDVVSNYNAWIVITGADKPSLGGYQLRDLLREVLIKAGVEWVASGRYFKDVVLN